MAREEARRLMRCDVVLAGVTRSSRPAPPLTGSPTRASMPYEYRAAVIRFATALLAYRLAEMDH
jgi:hypothetical protein